MKKNIIKKLGCIFGGLTFFLSIVIVSLAGPAHAQDVFAEPGYTIAPTIDPGLGIEISLFKNGERVMHTPMELVFRDDSPVIPILTVPGTPGIGFATTVHSAQDSDGITEPIETELPSVNIVGGPCTDYRVTFWPVRTSPLDMTAHPQLVPGRLNMISFTTELEDRDLKVITDKWGIFEIKVVVEAQDTCKYTVKIVGNERSVEYRFEKDGVFKFKKDVRQYLALDGFYDKYWKIDYEEDEPVQMQGEPVMINFVPNGENYRVSVTDVCNQDSELCLKSITPSLPHNAVRVAVLHRESDVVIAALLVFVDAPTNTNLGKFGQILINIPIGAYELIIVPILQQGGGDDSFETFPLEQVNYPVESYPPYIEDVEQTISVGETELTIHVIYESVDGVFMKVEDFFSNYGPVPFAPVQVIEYGECVELVIGYVREKD